MIQVVWSEEVDALFCVGQSLEPLGVRNWAIDQAGTLDVLERLRALGIAVAGGDVYRRNSDGLESTYDDWYCNREADESETSYLERSVELARRYILDYPNAEGDALFALVPVVR
ncbi:Imm40 family immunity protein [Stenotrophomonas sp. AB1(2024)]|uniref:Imm40 family immunity protein n=1 Tax=Stenotrophomonas sp. AB1(2024) TaxID=3132215 RepID=UPI00309B12A8